MEHALQKGRFNPGAVVLHANFAMPIRCAAGTRARVTAANPDLSTLPCRIERIADQIQ